MSRKRQRTYNSIPSAQDTHHALNYPYHASAHTLDHRNAYDSGRYNDHWNSEYTYDRNYQQIYRDNYAPIVTDHHDYRPPPPLAPPPPPPPPYESRYDYSDPRYSHSYQDNATSYRHDSYFDQYYSYNPTSQSQYSNLDYSNNDRYSHHGQYDSSDPYYRSRPPEPAYYDRPYNPDYQNNVEHLHLSPSYNRWDSNVYNMKIRPDSHESIYYEPEANVSPSIFSRRASNNISPSGQNETSKINRATRNLSMIGSMMAQGVKSKYGGKILNSPIKSPSQRNSVTLQENVEPTTSVQNVLKDNDKSNTNGEKVSPLPEPEPRQIKDSEVIKTLNLRKDISICHLAYSLARLGLAYPQAVEAVKKSETEKAFDVAKDQKSTTEPHLTLTQQKPFIPPVSSTRNDPSKKTNVSENQKSQKHDSNVLSNWSQDSSKSNSETNGKKDAPRTSSVLNGKSLQHAELQRSVSQPVIPLKDFRGSSLTRSQSASPAPHSGSRNSEGHQQRPPLSVASPYKPELLHSNDSSYVYQYKSSDQLQSRPPSRNYSNFDKKDKHYSHHGTY